MMKKPLVDKRYLLVDWYGRPGGRKFKFRHIKRAKSIYIQIFRLEVSVWYWEGK